MVSKDTCDLNLNHSERSSTFPVDPNDMQEVTDLFLEMRKYRRENALSNQTFSCISCLQGKRLKQDKQ